MTGAPHDVLPGHDLRLPLDQRTIQRLLPHRYPFLFVDRIIAFEPDRRIVGIKAVSDYERPLVPAAGGSRVFPSTLLIEAVAQVGALLVLLKPDNRKRLVFFMGIERVRFRRPVRANDVVEIEAVVMQLRDRTGRFTGVARVDGTTVAEGRMTFALGPTGATQG